MIPIHIALVRYKSKVETSILLRVAAALQMQLTRDFTPIWGIPATVSAFESLEHVPPGYLPLVIVKEGALQSREHAFHRMKNGQPIGLVEDGDGWPLAASHELLEMVVDPYGKHRAVGESIADVAAHTERESAVAPSPQGQVAYLVEICDPCQAVTYMVDGFEVSDFVTPQYYAPSATEAGRYSFTGAVTKPLEVLPQGYISWYVSDPKAPIWQAVRDAKGGLKVGPLPGPATADSRHDVDYAVDAVRGKHATSRSTPRTARADLAAESARRYGQELERDVKEILDSYDPAVPLDKFLKVLKELATDPDYYKQIKQNPDSLNDKLEKVIPQRFFFVGKEFPDQDTFKAAYKALNARKTREKLRKVPQETAITAMQGTTIWGPTPPPSPSPSPGH